MFFGFFLLGAYPSLMIKKPISVSVLANFQLAKGNATTALFFGNNL